MHTAEAGHSARNSGLWLTGSGTESRRMVANLIFVKKADAVVVRR